MNVFGSHQAPEFAPVCSRQRNHAPANCLHRTCGLRYVRGVAARAQGQQHVIWARQSLQWASIDILEAAIGSNSCGDSNIAQQDDRQRGAFAFETITHLAGKALCITCRCAIAAAKNSFVLHQSVDKSLCNSGNFIHVILGELRESVEAVGGERNDAVLHEGWSGVRQVVKAAGNQSTFHPWEAASTASTSKRQLQLESSG